MFFDCRTEFWWVSPYVSKGLWRGQLQFAQTHMESCIRKMLLQKMKWYAGTLHGFDYSAGKCGDALKDLLPADIWNGYLETFAACTEEDIWRALFKAGELFTELTKRTAKTLGVTVTDEYDRRVTSFLKYTKDLPRNAKTLDFHIE